MRTDRLKLEMDNRCTSFLPGKGYSLCLEHFVRISHMNISVLVTADEFQDRRNFPKRIAFKTLETTKIAGI
jgi:hypothetical protein